MLQQVLVLQQELVHARLRLQPGCCLRGQLVLQQVDLRDRGQPRHTSVMTMDKPEGGKAGRECPGAKRLFVSAQLRIREQLHQPSAQSSLPSAGGQSRNWQRWSRN